MGIVAFNVIPEINSTATTSVNEDSEYSYQFTVDDLDALDAVSLSAGIIPGWLSFDASTGVLSGTPENDDVGIHNIILNSAIVQQVADDVNLAQEFTITVANTNDTPIVSTAIADASTNEDAVYSYDASANFADVDSGDTATYTVSDNPTWMTIDSATGILSGTPDNDDIAVTNITVARTDTAGLSASDTFALTVDNTNDVPILTSDLPISEVNEDSVFTYDLSSHFDDVDIDSTFTYSFADSYHYEFLSFPGSNGNWTPESWLQLDAETGILTASPTSGNIEPYDPFKIGINVSDGESSITEYLYLRVNAVNDAPELTGDLTGGVLSGSNITYSGVLTGSDVDDAYISVLDIAANYYHQHQTFVQKHHYNDLHLETMSSKQQQNFRYLSLLYLIGFAL